MLLKYLKNLIVNSIDKVKKTARDKRHYESRLDLLRGYWTKIFENHLDLALYSEDPQYKDNAYFKHDQFAGGENHYIAAAARLQNEIDTINTEASTQQLQLGIWLPGINVQTNSQINAHLMQPASHPTPKIPIPNFSGMQKDWDSFKELFTARILSIASWVPQNKR